MASCSCWEIAQSTIVKYMLPTSRRPPSQSWKTFRRNRDRDGVYGHSFAKRLRAIGIRDRPIAARSPWQNEPVERLIGSIRRECN